jgi:hypothetical protein
MGVQMLHGRFFQKEPPGRRRQDYINLNLGLNLLFFPKTTSTWGPDN